MSLSLLGGVNQENEMVRPYSVSQNETHFHRLELCLHFPKMNKLKTRDVILEYPAVVSTHSTLGSSRCGRKR